MRKPSNVAVYFTVETHGGQPVANLTPQDFVIYEDKQPVSALESKQTILQPEVAAIHYTLLLVDMSGSVVDSGDMPALIQAASTFGDRVGPYQKVAVYTFDGSPHLTPVVPFGGNVRGGVSALATRRPRDPSTNLNGAVIEGIRVLAHQMEHAPVPLRFGTLVVFTDGTDRAHRASAEEVGQALDSAGFETYVIGAGQEVDKAQLSRIGRSGTFASQNPADVQNGFDEIRGAHRGVVAQVLPAVVLLAVARGRARGRDRGPRGRRERAARLPLQRPGLRPELRSQPASRVRRPPPAPDPAPERRGAIARAGGPEPHGGGASRGRAPWAGLEPEALTDQHVDERGGEEGHRDVAVEVEEGDVQARQVARADDGVLVDEQRGTTITPAV